MNCTKAIIPVAGYGTRRLPITKAIEKCMLPIGNRPLVDYVVEDCIKAGITDIYFVVSEESDQIRRYYGHNDELEGYLRNKGKTELLESIKPRKDVRFHFVTQDALAKYGTAIPVWECRDLIARDEYFLVLMGDDFIYSPNNDASVSKDLIACAQNADAALIGVEVAREETGRYGVFSFQADGEEKVFEEIVEGPDPASAPSNLINVSKYIFKGDIFDYLEPDVKIQPSSKGEYYIIDAINAYKAAGKRITLTSANGQYLDGGTVEGWLNANNVVLSK